MTERLQRWLDSIHAYFRRNGPNLYGGRLVHSQEEADRIVDRIRRSPPPPITLAGNTP